MAISANKRHDVFMKTFYHCAYCGKILSNAEDLTIDHKTPKAKGGKDEIDNLFGCCKSCNGIKADKTVSEFRKQLMDAAKISNAFSGERYNQNVVFFFEKYTKEDLIKLNQVEKSEDATIEKKITELDEKYNKLIEYIDYISDKVDNCISQNNNFNNI